MAPPSSPQVKIMSADKRSMQPAKIDQAQNPEGATAQFTYFQCEVSGEVMDFSPGWTVIWGWDKDSTLGVNILDFIYDKDKQKVRDELLNLVGKKKLEFQLAAISIIKNGRQMPVAIYGKLNLNSDGRPLFISLVFIPTNPDFATFRVVANAIHAINNSLLVITGTASRLVKIIIRDEKNLDLEATKVSLGKVEAHAKKVEKILADLRKQLDPDN